jgi:hypothetical protein
MIRVCSCGLQGQGTASPMVCQQRCPPPSQQLCWSPMMTVRLAAVDELAKDTSMALLCFLKNWFNPCNKTLCVSYIYSIWACLLLQIYLLCDFFPFRQDYLGREIGAPTSLAALLAMELCETKLYRDDRWTFFFSEIWCSYIFRWIGHLLSTHFLNIQISAVSYFT